VGLRARRLQRFLTDRKSGAAELAQAALAIMEEARGRDASPAQLERLAHRLCRAHPTMASVWNAAHATEPAAFGRALRRDVRATVRTARRHLPSRAVVLTLSYSSTVLAALSRRDLRVVVGESLPGGEGRTTARRLSRDGITARVVPDTMMAVAAQRADCGVVGADAVTPDTVINKVGTRLLALACQDADIPCYVLADSSKFVSAEWPQPDLARHRLFEATPRHIFTAVLSGGPRAETGSAV
jgi:translation initiation factor eIF-2B subunit delta